jgi:predicted O-linked N-acetylglucosamine transferase (SPINDLY family)
MPPSIFANLRNATDLARARRLRRSGDAAAAEALYRDALRRDPAHAEAHRELSDLLSARGAAGEALQHGLEALHLRPGWADAHNSAGVALHALGRLEEAIGHFRGALQAEASHAPAHVNLGNALADQGDIDTALSHYGKALEIEPDNATAQLTLAIALEDDGRYEEALAAYGRAQALAPNDGIRIKMATMLPLYPRSAAEIDELRARLERQVDALMAQPLRLRDPAREVGQTAFLLPYHGRNDRDLQVKLAALYAHACPELLFTAPHCRQAQAPRPRIRVGFASKFFTAHSVGIWFNRLISLLAADPGFEVVLIDLNGAADADLRAACARSIAPPQDLALARAAIAAEALDVLVYADIGMDPLSYFLAFSRLAPVQCAMLGHPVTTGIRNIDYFISSALFEREDAQAHYSERLVRLNSLPLYIPRPLPPATGKSRAELGLPEGRTLYACPMMLHKFHPDFDAAMAGILRRDPDAEILLFRDSRYPRRHEGLARRFAAAHGDVAARLRFLPWASLEDLMRIIQASDLVIDTFHFSAGTTAFLVFAFGTPLVTLPGDYVRGRPTYGCYLKMGMLDCVARDPGDYVDLAVRIGTDRALRDTLRGKILASCETLYADPAAVAELAAFLRRTSSSRAASSTTESQTS